MIYIGPNDKPRGLSYGTKFRTPYPEHVQAAITADPTLAKQFIPFSKFVTMAFPGTKKLPKSAPASSPVTIPIRNHSTRNILPKK
ncbi:MAG: hypothetical protein ABSC15_02995 [Terriglobales bacterium]